MADSNWESKPESGPIPITPEHALVWHIYESVLVYALVCGLGIYTLIESWDQKLWVLCSVIPVLIFCLWADVRKRQKLRAAILARLSASLVSGDAKSQLCKTALGVLGYDAYVPYSSSAPAGELPGSGHLPS